MRLPFSGEGGAVPSRSDLLDRANKAREKNNKKKAITLYREALALDDQDPDTQLKLAPLLAGTKEKGAAYAAYRAAAEGFVEKGFLDKAIGAYRGATEQTPDFEEAWERISELQLERELPADAIATLAQGRKRYKRAYDRPRAIRLLTRLQQLQPDRLSVAADLARQLKRSGRRAEARQLLNDLALRREPGSLRRRVRRSQLRLFFSPRVLWWWIRGR